MMFYFGIQHLNDSNPFSGFQCAFVLEVCFKCPELFFPLIKKTSNENSQDQQLSGEIGAPNPNQEMIVFLEWLQLTQLVMNCIFEELEKDNEIHF